MSKNMQRLASIMANRMNQTSQAAVRTSVELGTVNENLSITPDSLRVAIPKGDYMVDIKLTGEKHTGYGHSGEYSHRHQLPAEYRSLRPGDRILISWCGYEPVVIAIVGTSSVLKLSDGDDTSGGGSTGSGSDSGNSGGSGSGGTFTEAEVEAIVQDVVGRVTALLEEKFYTKDEIDEKIGGFITGEEMSTVMGEVFGTGK